MHSFHKRINTKVKCLVLSRYIFFITFVCRLRKLIIFFKRKIIKFKFLKNCFTLFSKIKNSLKNVSLKRLFLVFQTFFNNLNDLQTVFFLFYLLYIKTIKSYKNTYFTKQIASIVMFSVGVVQLSA